MKKTAVVTAGTGGIDYLSDKNMRTICRWRTQESLSSIKSLLIL